jgi:hypothetical protein
MLLLLLLLLLLRRAACIGATLSVCAAVMCMFKSAGCTSSGCVCLGFYRQIGFTSGTQRACTPQSPGAAVDPQPLVRTSTWLHLLLSPNIVAWKVSYTNPGAFIGSSKWCELQMTAITDCLCCTPVVQAYLVVNV